MPETREARTTLPVWRKIAYGSGDSGFSLTSTALALLYLFFLVNVVGLDPAWAGLSLGIGRIWDAFNDLIIGTLSDRTRSRWGRRRPYLLFGAIPFGITFILMWLVPPTNEQTLLLVYYTGMYILFDTMFTLTNVPYIALTPEIAPTYDERTSLHSYRMAFSIGSAWSPRLCRWRLSKPLPGRTRRWRNAVRLMRRWLSLLASSVSFRFT